MWREIYEFVQASWMEWLFLAVSGAAGLGYRRVMTHQKEDRERNNALSAGVQALLRDRIIQAYNLHSEKGYCPIYAKDNVRRLFTPYSELEHDTVITELVGKLLQMPTEKHII